MQISVEIKDNGINTVLERMKRKGEDMPGALRIVGERVLRQTDARFTAQRDADGRPWAPLKPATLKHKKNPMILTESHHLRDSIRSQVSGNVLRVGTNKVYGAIHQLGGTIKKASRSETFTRNRGSNGRFGKGTKAGRGFTFKAHGVTIAARPFLGIGKDDSKDIVEVLTDWLEA